MTDNLTTTDSPELPGGEIRDTQRPDVEMADTELEPLPGGEVERREPDERLRFTPLDHRLLFQELVRAALAFSFVVLLAVVVIFGFSKVDSRSWGNVKEFLDVLIPAISALLGSATGFYFASRR